MRSLKQNNDILRKESMEKNMNNRKKKKNNGTGKAYEAVRAYSDDASPLGSYTGTPTPLGEPPLKEGKRYVRIAGIAPLVDSTGGGAPDVMMPPVLPSEFDAEIEKDLEPTQDADDL